MDIGSKSTSVAAGEAFDLPVSGTIAHSRIQSFEAERVVFEAFIEEHGEDSVLLIDTTTPLMVPATRSKSQGDRLNVGGVRLGSGDLAALTKAVAEILPGGRPVSLLRD